MQRYRLMRRYRRRAPFTMRLLCFFFGIFTALLLIDMQLRPYIKAISSYQAKAYATRVINDAIYEELCNENIGYNNLVTLTENIDGEITSLQTDMVAMNRLRSKITEAVLEKISTMDTQHIYISSGTLSGVQILSGRGPKIKIKVSPAGYMQTELENRFESAGINQTKHQILLKLTMKITAIIPGFTVSTDVYTEFCLAETVIVGTVPGAFTQISDANDELTQMITDYEAKEP